MSETTARETMALPTPVPAPEAPLRRGEIILKMYAAALRMMSEAEAALVRREDGDPRAASNAMSHVGRAQGIIEELRQSLDHGVAPDLCASLDRLYEFVLHRLDCCLEDRDPAHLAIAADILTTLLDAWEEVLQVPEPHRHRNT
jgi:flagellar biosynthetic protein FliS